MKAENKLNSGELILFMGIARVRSILNPGEGRGQCDPMGGPVVSMGNTLSPAGSRLHNRRVEKYQRSTQKPINDIYARMPGAEACT